MFDLDALNTVSWGTLVVITAHDLAYMMRASLTMLMAGRPGAMKRPIQIMPWLFTRWRMFSATWKEVCVYSINKSLAREKREERAKMFFADGRIQTCAGRAQLISNQSP